MPSTNTSSGRKCGTCANAENDDVRFNALFVERVTGVKKIEGAKRMREANEFGTKPFGQQMVRDKSYDEVA